MNWRGPCTVVLVDTSAWIEFFRADGAPRVREEVAAQLVSGSAAYTCPVLYEVLVGARPHEVRGIERCLRQATRIEFLPSYWDGAAQLGQKLLRKGITTTPGDVQIAYAAIAHEVPVLCCDRHFSLIQRAVGGALALVQLS